MVHYKIYTRKTWCQYQASDKLLEKMCKLTGAFSKIESEVSVTKQVKLSFIK